MSRMNWKRFKLAVLPLMMISSMVHAERAGFYTIVGPDGRIMVIDRNAAVPEKSEQPRKVESEPVSPQVPPSQQVQQVVESVPETPQQPALTPLPVVTAPAPLTQGSGQATASDHKKAVPAQAAASKAAVQPPVPVVAPANNTLQSSALPDLPARVAMPAKPATAVKAVTKAATERGAATSEASSDAKNPVSVVNGEQYIDSEYLEQREFNLDGKKRFYSLPGVFGGTQVLEREKGVDMNVFKGPKIEAPRVVTLSKDYQRLDAKQVSDLTGVQCFTKEQMEKAKLLKSEATLDFWPRPSFEPKFDFVVAAFENSVSDIELTSYAATTRNPLFYWPLPIFLDKNACVMEGVNAFYQRTIAANSLQHQAVQGLLHVPQGAKYLLLTPLESAADLTELKLTNKGQIRLTPIR